MSLSVLQFKIRTYLLRNLLCHKCELKMSKKRKAEILTQNNKKQNSHWSLALLNSMEDPEYQVQSDDLTVVIKDKFPKAEYHYLIIPRENISSLKAVGNEHKSLLKHMHDVAEKLVENPEHKNRNFLIGYHAEASMFRLHLHLISDDLNSSSLKTKKHWNSYTTDFFLKSKNVCEELEKNGKVLLPPKESCKEFLNTPLKCHKCHFNSKTIPDLKKHIITHVT